MKYLFLVFTFLINAHFALAAQANEGCDFPVFDIPELDKNIPLEAPLIRFVEPNHVVLTLFGVEYAYDPTKVTSSIAYSNGEFFMNFVSRTPYGKDIVFSADGCKISGVLPTEALIRLRK